MIEPITIIGISSLSALLALVIMGSLVRTGIPGTREWCWANVLLITGMLLTVSRDVMPLAWSLIAGNGFLGAAALLQLLGVRRFLRRRTPLAPLIAGFALMMALIVWFQYGQDRFNLRVTVFSTFHAAVMLAQALSVLANRPAGRPKYSYYYMTGISATAVLVNLVRGIAYARGWAPDAGPFVPTPWHIFFLSISTMAAPAMTAGMVMMAHDRMSAALERHANIDFLTELLGRRAFISEAFRECTRAQHFRRPMSVAIFDIDFFKAINDRYGHAGGDDVLAHFAMLLTASTRASDINGRIGGEEFALLLPETGMDAAVRVVERFQQRLAASPCLIGQRPVPCTFSAGIAEFRAGDKIDVLMERADRALYKAKQTGRNKIVTSGSAAPNTITLPDAHATLTTVMASTDAIDAGDLLSVASVQRPSRSDSVA